MSSGSPPMFRAQNRGLVILGLFGLALGLAGHLAAAVVEGGRAIHYRDHVIGFIILSVASAIIALVLERWIWKQRRDVTILVVGALQTLLGWSIFVLFSHGTR